MGYHPRIETTDVGCLITSRCRNSELWFINNRDLQQAILGYLAKYTELHQVNLYAFAIAGNHLHQVAVFPQANRAPYMRVFNSTVAKAVARYVTNYPGGKLFARRYSAEYLPTQSDIEDKFFYTVLQAVQDGLVDNIFDHPGYNCFDDAVSGIARKFEVVDWTAYNEARRWNSSVSIKDYVVTHELSYKRLPGYEELPQAEYRALMYRKLEERQRAIIEQRGKPCMGRAALLMQVPGSTPIKTKTSTQSSHRPRVLAKNPAVRSVARNWYFTIYDKYKEASALYRAGALDTRFPAGTYRPPMFTVQRTVGSFSP